MVPSVDGRIVIDDWKAPRTLHTEYEKTAKTFDANAWIIGRISMEPFAGDAKIPPYRGPRLPRTDFIAKRDASSFAIAIDPSGKLRWKSAAIDEEHVVTVLTEKVSDRYLAFLRARGISYVFGGASEVNLGRVLAKLRKHFGIERLLLEGGGKINGAFLAADLVDELSILIAPIADGSVGTPTLFDAPGSKSKPRNFALVSVSKRAGDLVWIRYRRAS